MYNTTNKFYITNHYKHNKTDLYDLKSLLVCNNSQYLFLKRQFLQSDISDISWLHWTALEEWPPTERAIMKPWQKSQKCEVGKVGRPAVGVAITSYTFLPLKTFYVGAKKEAGCKTLLCALCLSLI